MFARPCMLLTLSALIVAGWTAVADSQEKKSDSFPVAILNLDILFKQDPQVAKALEELKADAAEIDEKVRLRQAELESVASELRQAQAGSSEQRRLQQQFVKLNGELQQFIARERSNVQLSEAKIYLTAYRAAEPIVKEYCQEHGIKLVLRQQATSLDENQPAQEIQKALNRIVIYDDELDITPEIQARLKAKVK